MLGGVVVVTFPADDMAKNDLWTRKIKLVIRAATIQLEAVGVSVSCHSKHQ